MMWIINITIFNYDFMTCFEDLHTDYNMAKLCGKFENYETTKLR